MFVTESLLPSVCLKTLTILPLLLFQFLRVLILELTTLTGVSLGVLVIPLPKLTLDTSVTITLLLTSLLPPPVSPSVQGLINLNFSVHITVSLSW